MRFTGNCQITHRSKGCGQEASGTRLKLVKGVLLAISTPGTTPSLEDTKYCHDSPGGKTLQESPPYLLGKTSARKDKRLWAQLSWQPAVLLLPSRWKQWKDPSVPVTTCLSVLPFSLRITPIHPSAPSSGIAYSTTPSRVPRWRLGCCPPFVINKGAHHTMS